MERLCLLANGLTLGIFFDDSLPLVFVILSSKGDFVHISSETCAEIHLTKCCPSRYLREVLQTLHFKNTYDIHSSYACPRFHGQALRTHPLVSNEQFLCPFRERISFEVPVTYHQEAPCGLSSFREVYCVHLQKVFSLRSSHQLPFRASSTASESGSMTSSFSSSSSVRRNFQFQLPDCPSSISSLHLNGSAEVLALYEDLVEEFSLMRSPDYFPSSHVPLIESLNRVLYVNCCREHSERGVCHEFQIWFDLPVNWEGKPWQPRAELIALRQDIVRHHIREERDDHTTLTSQEDQSCEEGRGVIQRVDHSYSLSVLELDDQLGQDGRESGPSVLKRKPEIAHLLRLRDHTNRLWRVESPHSVGPQHRPCHVRPLPAIVIQFERFEYDKSGLYLLSDGRVRGVFPRDNLLLDYLPETRALRTTLPDGREEMYSVDSLLRFRDERELMATGREVSLRETLLSLVTRRMLQLLSFRRRAIHSSCSSTTTDSTSRTSTVRESRQTEIEVTVSQYRNRKFLSEVSSLLSLSP
jgi:hypothetical protein